MAPRSAGSRSSRRLKEEDVDHGGLADVASRHRVPLAGTTAFVVAFSYVAANAIWYQPHAHGGAFFQTRPISADLARVVTDEDVQAETIIRIEQEAATAPQPTPQSTVRPKPSDIETIVRQNAQAQQVPVPQQGAMPAAPGDPVIMEVQRVLASLKFYDGTIDGLTGPRTREAVENYRKTMGLNISADIDRQLLDQLGIPETATVPLPRNSPGTDLIETASAVPAAAKAPEGDRTVMRIQAGLKAFGNEGIDIDGVVGSRTRSAILEFQSLFGLPETGEPDNALYAKMREIGLTE